MKTQAYYGSQIRSFPLSFVLSGLSLHARTPPKEAAALSQRASKHVLQESSVQQNRVWHTLGETGGEGSRRRRSLSRAAADISGLALAMCSGLTWPHRKEGGGGGGTGVSVLVQEDSK